MKTETMPGWGSLEPNEQDKLTTEMQALDKATTNYEMSNLEIGEHLDRIQSIMAPKRQFNKWLTWWLKNRKKAKSRAWAYQALKEYQDVRNSTPKQVLDLAKQRGTKLNVAVLAHNPPPKTTDRSAIVHYLDSIKPERVEVVKGPDQLLKECLNFVGTRWAQLPNNQKTRTAFMRSLMGMLLAKFGVASEISFAPMAIPDAFKIQRGRPKAA
jgi:hypothetical protein